MPYRPKLVLIENNNMEEIEKIVDIETAIRNGNNKFLKSLPGFVVRFLKRAVYQDEINATIHKSRHLAGVPFINEILRGWNIKIDIRGIENIPSAGRYVFAANHPVGAMDALSFFSVVNRFFPEVVSPSNELLNHIINLRPLILGLNVFGKNTKETVVRLHNLFESDIQVLIFPSGEVSRRKNGIISDPVWQKSFITKAIQYKRDIIPFHLSGKNSNLFYNVSNLRSLLGIKMYVETMLLPREMMKQRNSTVTVTIGKVIPYQTFTTEYSQIEWAQKVKSIVYSLPENKN
jgi:putative hemolysin